MCLQSDKVPFGWVTNYHSTVFATSIDPEVLQQVWGVAQTQHSLQSSVDRGRMLQEHLRCRKLYLSRIISWNATIPHARLAYRAFSKLAALVRQDCDAYEAHQEKSAAVAAAYASSVQSAPAPGPEPGTSCSPTEEPPAQRLRRSGQAPRYTYAYTTSRQPLKHTSSVVSSSSATTTADVYDMEEFKLVGRLGDHCFDTFWRGSRLVLKHDESH